ncbi:MAG: hypothetical protein GY854_08760 [Deltaproteobacteria bacterium]|nr:hypothetical protein [Deltaproteobacteria bacterium]
MKVVYLTILSVWSASIIVGCSERKDESSKPPVESVKLEEEKKVAPTKSGTENQATKVVESPRMPEPDTGTVEDIKPSEPAIADDAQKKIEPVEAETSAQKAGELELVETEGLRIASLVLGNGVEKVDGKKLPLNPGTMFSVADTQRVLVFMQVENPESLETELAVSFLPPDGKKERGGVSVKIPARTKWSTRAFYKIKRPLGTWTAIVRHEETVIARAPFELTE